MAKTKLEIVEEIHGWGYTLDMVNAGLSSVTEDDTVIIPINSYGGSVMEGTAVYNLIKGSKAKTEAHILGYAMSMGTVIASACNEVVMPKNGYYMIHEPAMLEWGDADTFSNSAAFLNTIGMDAAKIYSDKTGKTVDEIRAMMKKTTWLNAEQALEMGFVDRLSEGTEIHASLDPKLFKNAPKELVLQKEEESTYKKMVADMKAMLGLSSDDKQSELQRTITNLQTQVSTHIAELATAKSDLATAQASLSTETARATTLANQITEKDARIVELEAMDAGAHPGGGTDDSGKSEEKLYHQTPLSKRRRELIAQSK